MMQRWVLMLAVLMITSTTQAQTDAVTFAADAGVFVGAAAACREEGLVQLYTHRVRLVLAELTHNTTDASHAAAAFAKTQVEARNWHTEHPDVTPCPAILRIVRQQPLLHEVNRAVQRRLRNLGFNPGPLDGIWGRKTTSALLRYQAAQGLPATGVLDRATIRALGIELPGVS